MAQKIDKNEKKKIFESEYDKCSSRSEFTLKNVTPELHKAFEKINSKSKEIGDLKSDLRYFKGREGYMQAKKLNEVNVPMGPKAIDILKYQMNTASDKQKEILDKKLSLLEFVCNSLNCKKGQISITNPLGDMKYDPKEYLVRDIQVHLGNLVSHLTLNEINRGVVFPKYIFGDFELYIPISTDFSKITYPEYVSGDIMITW